MRNLTRTTVNKNQFTRGIVFLNHFFSLFIAIALLQPIHFNRALKKDLCTLIQLNDYYSQV